MVILISGSAVVLAAELTSGVPVVDASAVTRFLGLLTAIFFIYSIFFLGTANQTIGMMMMHLRVVGTDQRRPGLRSLLIRSLCFLPSLLLMGGGLIWALLDRDSSCLHDRFSRTRVVSLV